MKKEIIRTATSLLIEMKFSYLKLWAAIIGGPSRSYTWSPLSMVIWVCCHLAQPCVAAGISFASAASSVARKQFPSAAEMILSHRKWHACVRGVHLSLTIVRWIENLILALSGEN